uniref:Fucolectin tachylectin-4 pentraxin-1 domain-containing protein n=1 Tax=Strigamia maritima TaxID=126957 RepID=T1JBY8_STRMM
MKKTNGKLKWLLLLLLLLCCCVGGVSIAVGYAASKALNKAKCIKEGPFLNLSSKNAAQSTASTYLDFNVNLAQDDSNLTCSHTNGDDKEDTFPWWRLDLEDQYVITKITFLGRPGFPLRNDDLELRIGNFVEEGLGGVFFKNGLCGEFPGSNKLIIHFHFVCPKMLFGRYITIQKVKISDSALCICGLTFEGHIFVP